MQGRLFGTKDVAWNSRTWESGKGTTGDVTSRMQGNDKQSKLIFFVECLKYNFQRHPEVKIHVTVWSHRFAYQTKKVNACHRIPEHLII